MGLEIQSFARDFVFLDESTISFVASQSSICDWLMPDTPHPLPVIFPRSDNPSYALTHSRRELLEGDCSVLRESANNFAIIAQN